MQGERKTAVQCPVSDGLLRIEGIRENIFRCVYTKKKEVSSVSALEIDAVPETGLAVEETENRLHISSRQITLTIEKGTGRCAWKTAKTGRVLLQESRGELTQAPYMKYELNGDAPIIRREKTVDGERNFVENLEPVKHHMAYRGRIWFQFQEGEKLHGLGQGEEGIYDYRGKVQYLYQHNMRIPIPFLVSDKGYGILADCGSLMTFNDDSRGSYFYLDMVEQIDYYFIAGASMDEIIAGYRALTGKAAMLPKWAFGYVQSKEAYYDQKELIDTAAEYRKRRIPIDCIVQDWNTWEDGAWGNKRMDNKRYPDIAGMNRKLHSMHVHSMLSIWPNMNSGTEDYVEMEEHGCLLHDFSTYDAFSKEARELYWKQMKGLFDGGFDSWWCDSTEPFSGPDWNGESLREPWERFALVGKEHKKFLDPDRANLYALAHAGGIYENQRKENPDKRVLNLTRSGYPSIQKYGTVLWSGDISATWGVFKKQIAEGLNVGLSGMPYWTLDAGGFFTVRENWRHRGCRCANDPTPKWFWCGDYEEGVDDYGYRELYVRWLQYAAFLPMFRSHGTDTPREIWNFGEPGELFYEAIAKTIVLRYRFMPYIYSMAGKVWREDYTMVRSLLFDFPEDKKAAAMSSEFMFGDSLLICPVTEPIYYEKGNRVLEREREWNCYLPAGCDWYDFHTGVKYPGGTDIRLAVCIDRIPVFVKAGSVIPMEQGLQYAQEEVETPLTFHIYPGGDGELELYEDEGDGYEYESGDYQVVAVRWNEREQCLTVGRAERKYPQGIVGRSCEAVLEHERKAFRYTGEEIAINLCIINKASKLACEIIA